MHYKKKSPTGQTNHSPYIIKQTNKQPYDFRASFTQGKYLSDNIILECYYKI